MVDRCVEKMQRLKTQAKEWREGRKRLTLPLSWKLDDDEDVNGWREKEERESLLLLGEEVRE